MSRLRTDPPVDPAVDGSLSALSDRLGYQFDDLALLREAMSHRSWCAEQPGSPRSNERLEFLGDAVLGWVVADLAFTKYADEPEGRLSDLRKNVVNARALAQVAEAVDIGSALLLGKGEAAAGGRRKPSILSDALEAVIGAIYVDGGAEVAYDFVEKVVVDGLRGVDVVDQLDARGMLMELCLRRLHASPRYEVTEEGPAHAKVFHAVVLLGDEEIGDGSGHTKKVAIQAAAARAFERMSSRVATAGAD